MGTLKPPLETPLDFDAVADALAEVLNPHGLIKDAEAEGYLHTIYLSDRSSDHPNPAQKKRLRNEEIV